MYHGAVGCRRTRLGEVLRDRPARDGQAVAVQQSGVEQLPHHDRDTADAVEVAASRTSPPGARRPGGAPARLIRSKSSSSSSTPASCAIASRCRTAFVEPASAIVTAIAFCERVLRDDVARTEARLEQPRHRRCPTRARTPRAGSRRRAATPRRAATSPSPRRPRPSCSPCTCRRTNRSSGRRRARCRAARRRSIVPFACAPTASNTSWIVMSRPWYVPGEDRARRTGRPRAGSAAPSPSACPARTCRTRRCRRARRIRSACITSSTESAITSRLISEAFIPSWPIAMPSETAIVVNSIGTASPWRTPFLRERRELVEVVVARGHLVPRATRHRPAACRSPPRRNRPLGASRAPARVAGPSVTSQRTGALVGQSRDLLEPWQDGLTRYRPRRPAVEEGSVRCPAGHAPTARRRRRRWWLEEALAHPEFGRARRASAAGRHDRRRRDPRWRLHGDVDRVVPEGARTGPRHRAARADICGGGPSGRNGGFCDGWWEPDPRPPRDATATPTRWSCS